MSSKDRGVKVDRPPTATTRGNSGVLTQSGVPGGSIATSAPTSQNTALKTPIDDLNGQFDFLNLDYPCWVFFRGSFYPSVTVAYQAIRTQDPKLTDMKQEMSYQQFSAICRNSCDPANWAACRMHVMEILLRDKFKRSRILTQRLMATDGRRLFNCYSQGSQSEKYWGYIKQGESYRGYNHAGLIMAKLRDDIRKGVDTEKWLQSVGIDPVTTTGTKAPTSSAQTFSITLIISKDGNNLETLSLEGSSLYTVGSKDKNMAVIKLDHPSISKLHAAVFKANDVIQIVDLGSTNGTKLTHGGKIVVLPAFVPHRIAIGDTLSFGNSTRVFTYSK